MSTNKLIVDQELDGIRLDNFLSRYFVRKVPKSHVHKVIRTGQIRVNGKRSKSHTRLAVNDEVRIPPFMIKDSSDVLKKPQAKGFESKEAIEKFVNDNLLYQNKGMLVINKPSGIPVHGGSTVSVGLIEILKRDERFYNLELVHRLDMDTSGCLIVSKKRSYLRKLHELIREKKGIVKKYIALVHGDVKEDEFTINKPLKKIYDSNGNWKVVVDKDGSSSVSEVRVLERFKKATLVEVNLITGRTHQIRVHMKSIGHSIVGDNRYGINSSLEEIFKHKRLFLHASYIRLTDIDIEGCDNEIEINAPLPLEFEKGIKNLTSYIRECLQNG